MVVTKEQFNCTVKIEVYDGPMVGETCFRASVIIGAVEHSIQRKNPVQAKSDLFIHLQKEGKIYG